MNLLQMSLEVWNSLRDKKWPSGFTAVVNSKVLGERVIWAADDTVISDRQGMVVYREELIRKIVRLKLTPAELRTLHEALKLVADSTFQLAEIIRINRRNGAEVSDAL
jgi:hypothetical protein